MMDFQMVGSSVTIIAFGGGVFLLFLISFLSHHRGVVRPNNPKHLPSLPKVRGSVPLLGNLLQLKERKPYRTFTKWVETYGPIYSIKTGATSLVVVNSSHVAKEAMVTRFNSISIRKVSKALKILTADKTMVAMSDYGDYYKIVKHNLLSSVLGPDARKKNRVHRDSLVENLSYKLHALAPNSHREAVNLKEIFRYELFSLALKQLAINIYGCNMENEVWENLEEWNPERFLVKSEDLNLFTTMSFGGGKRVCAGAKQASLIVCVVLGRMVQEFEWSLRDDTGDDDNTLGITTHKLNPLLAVIKPRI